MRNFKLRYDVWYVRKYKGDVALYAECACGFKSGCYKMSNNLMVSPKATYPYCPMCGTKNS